MKDNRKKIVFILNPISGVINKSGIPKLVEKHLDKKMYDYSIVYT